MLNLFQHPIPIEPIKKETIDDNRQPLSATARHAAIVSASLHFNIPSTNHVAITMLNLFQHLITTELHKKENPNQIKDDTTLKYLANSNNKNRKGRPCGRPFR